MKILSIETSCDDTGITIMEVKGGNFFKILSDNLVVQSIHAQYGGVYPMMAKKKHLENLPILLEKTLKETKLEKSKKPVDLIAVTYGPGLEPCLWTGITFAQELAKKWKVPIIPTNHMEGHIISVFAKNKGSFKIPKIKYPLLSLLVSGGHTELVVSKSYLKYEIIGKTRDDAAGEAFDKVGRMLGLPYPGGPKISKLAEMQRQKEKQASKGLHSAKSARIEQFSSKKIVYPEKLGFSWSLPRPMLYSKDFDFSFAGLKTAVLYLIRDLTKKDSNILQNDKIKQVIALEFENSVVETLVHKTKKAMEQYGAKTIIISGGVAANEHLKREMKKMVGKRAKFLVPTRELSRDNALMIGIAGYLNYLKNKKKVPKPEGIKAVGNLKL